VSPKELLKLQPTVMGSEELKAVGFKYAAVMIFCPS
jgi:hypothetical protein